jgi:hypothetical protein
MKIDNAPANPQIVELSDITENHSLAREALYKS